MKKLLFLLVLLLSVFGFGKPVTKIKKVNKQKTTIVKKAKKKIVKQTTKKINKTKKVKVKPTKYSIKKAIKETKINIISDSKGNIKDIQIEEEVKNSSLKEQIKEESSKVLVGGVSAYGPGFHGRRTASGEIFNMNAMTAAHKTLPMGSLVKVTNKANGKHVVVKINDRGPYIKGRVLDLSTAAFSKIESLAKGVFKASEVKIEILSLGKRKK